MTIHHDKLAYGRLAKTGGEMTEDEIAKMLAELKGEESDKDEQPEKDEKNKNNG